METQTVRPVHVQVAGRARLQVVGLRRSPGLKARLEGGLPALSGVHAVIASTDTGNILVHFNPVLSLEQICQGIARLQRGEMLLTELRAASTGAGATADWHTRTGGEAAAALGTSMTGGLSSAEAEARLARTGANTLPAATARSRFAIFADQFRTLPFGLLAGAAAISLLSGGALEGLAILAVLALNGLVGCGVESRSERTIRSLGRESQRTASAMRNGAPLALALETIVPGDLLILRRGTVVPADARIIAAHDLTVSEAMLTGESQPISKSAAPLLSPGLPLADRVASRSRRDHACARG